MRTRTKGSVVLGHGPTPTLAPHVMRPRARPAPTDDRCDVCLLFVLVLPIAAVAGVGISVVVERLLRLRRR